MISIAVPSRMMVLLASLPLTYTSHPRRAFPVRDRTKVLFQMYVTDC
jgi:hypothetical protein